MGKREIFSTFHHFSHFSVSPYLHFSFSPSPFRLFRRPAILLHKYIILKKYFKQKTLMIFFIYTKKISGGVKIQGCLIFLHQGGVNYDY